MVYGSKPGSVHGSVSEDYKHITLQNLVYEHLNQLLLSNFHRIASILTRILLVIAHENPFQLYNSRNCSIVCFVFMFQKIYLVQF